MSPHRRSPLRRRLALAFVAFGVACAALGLTVAFVGAILPSRQALDTDILTQASELLACDDENGHAALLSEIALRGAALGQKGWQYACWSVGTGTLLAGNVAPPPDPIHAGRPRDFRFEERLFRAVVFELPEGRALMVGHDISRQAVLERRMIVASMAAGVVMVALSIGGGLWLSRTLLERIEQMNRTVLAILRGNRAERLPVRARVDESDELAEHFNELLDENERLIARMREVTNDIAHDLRTPLARVRSDLEAALAKPRSGAQDAEVLATTLEAIEKLLGTFQALLDIAQIESGRMQEVMVALDLSGIARDIVELYGPVAEERGITLRADLAEGVQVRGNRHLLAQTLSNLVDNAIKFSPAASTVTIAVRPVRAGGAGPELVVADHGPGILPAEHEHVLQRFVRLDPARGAPGTGLGLSLVAAVAKLHGARLGFTDNAPGLVATLEFPPA